MYIHEMVATGAQVAKQLNSGQVLACLSVVTVLVLLAMVWRAWSSIFPQSFSTATTLSVLGVSRGRSGDAGEETVADRPKQNSCVALVLSLVEGFVP